MNELDPYPSMPNMVNGFVSVYDNVDGYGRTKSISYRIYRGVKKLEPRKVEVKSEKRRYKNAVKRLREMS